MALSPNGPRGPRESSSASSLVVWIGMRRMGPRDLLGVDFAGAAEDALKWSFSDCFGVSSHGISLCDYP